MATAVWFQAENELTSRPLTEPRWLSATGSLTCEASLDSIPIAPVSRYPGVLATLLVPDELHRRVALNGLAVEAGLLPLRHADHFEFAGLSFWVAGQFLAEETDYSPTRHDPEARCCLTKARLREGEPITICTGAPGNACGVIYKRAAWRTVTSKSATFRCPHCSFDPNAPTWRPTVRAIRPALTKLFPWLNAEEAR